MDGSFWMSMLNCICFCCFLRQKVLERRKPYEGIDAVINLSHFHSICLFFVYFLPFLRSWKSIMYKIHNHYWWISLKEEWRGCRIKCVGNLVGILTANTLLAKALPGPMFYCINCWGMVILFFPHIHGVLNLDLDEV